jgi:hypothetical protein
VNPLLKHEEDNDCQSSDQWLRPHGTFRIAGYARTAQAGVKRRRCLFLILGKHILCAVPSKRSRRETMAVLQIWLENISPRPFAEETVFVSLRKHRHGFPSHRNRTPLFPSFTQIPSVKQSTCKQTWKSSQVASKLPFALVNPFFAEVFHEPGKNMQ